jgi:UDP-glucose 4-epimerase
MQGISSSDRILVTVTGGAGFIGSRTVRRLLNEGANVVVLDDFFTGSEGNLPVHDPKLEIVRGSVTQYELVRDVVKGVRFVLHLAARNIIVSTRNPREDFEVNIGGTLNILLAAREHATPRVVYASSCSIYGNPRYLPSNEDEGANMLSPYAVSKYAGENYCKAFYENYGLSTTAVRYSNVYGPGQSAANSPPCPPRLTGRSTTLPPGARSASTSSSE